MQTALGVSSSNPEKRQSPMSSSRDSFAQDSSRPPNPETSSTAAIPLSTSPRATLTRKRAAPLNPETANLLPHIESLALHSASSSSPRREQVCLCQPDPKIPRPRNAFILYRQHYQAQVVAQYPRLANPDISKIIGEQWRTQTPEVKSDWKRLAEEEKQRHQRQYPGYRYQPRRAGKSTGIRTIVTASTDDLVRCPKCSGRYISTPSTPLTPFTPGVEAKTDLTDERVPPTLTRPSTPRVVQLYSTEMEGPRTGQDHRRFPNPQVHPLHTLHENEEDGDLLSPSSDPKRRRFNDEPQSQPVYASSPTSLSNSRPFLRNAAVPLSATTYRQRNSSGAELQVRPVTRAQSAQQSPVTGQPRHQYSTRSSTYDESLRLPPLQTQISNSTLVASQRPSARTNQRDAQARSVEAMVMTIPYINKIKLLSKISPPLARPGPSSPAQKIRGSVIAVEGADSVLLAEIGDFLAEYLGHEPFCALQSWTTAMPPNLTTSPSTTNTEIPSANVSAVKSPILGDDSNRDPFVEYLSVISEYHVKSREIATFITGSPERSSGKAKTSSTAINSVKIIPVAILSRGFSLTTSDIFSLRIPINDSYAPVDHWQWMATLWRGIIGPDLTIYTKRADREELERCGGVEIRSDCAAIVVRVPETGSMDEKTARRLGFEILEAVRNVEAGVGR